MHLGPHLPCAVSAPGFCPFLFPVLLPSSMCKNQAPRTRAGLSLRVGLHMVPAFTCRGLGLHLT